jgi:AhpD family alkylhydroperoxidase
VGPCDENLKSFAHMAVASLVGCGFCLDLGYFQAHNEGLDVAKAREVPRWRESDVFTPLERDVMEYAEAMTRPRRRSPTGCRPGCWRRSARPRSWS